MKSIDLHIHSTYSEGNLTPKQIVQIAKKLHLAVISLCDHDGLDGVPEAIFWGKKLGVKIIPGVEIYADYKKWTLHLIGYGIDLENKALNNLLKNLQEKHLKDVQKTVINLQKIGFEIDFKKLIKTSSKYIGLGQIISALNKKPKNLLKIKRDIAKNKPTFFDIIKQYFTENKKAYLPEASTSFAKALSAIKSAGGLPILAHPGQQLKWDDDQVILELKKLGILGLEVITPYHSFHQIEHYQQIAHNLNLVITGGTDLHTSQISALGPIKNQWDYFCISYQIYNNLKKYLK